MAALESLASYRNCIQRIKGCWPAFQQKRAERLQQQQRFGVAAEKVAENIIEDLFTEVLDWGLGDLNNQVGYADIELTNHGIKRLLIEVKRPGALHWNRRAVEKALEQARRYADQQRVKCIAVSDGAMLYAADITQGGLHDLVFLSLVASEPPLALWWLSVHGIYHSRAELQATGLPRLAESPTEPAMVGMVSTETLLHPKYKLPMDCFAHVEHANKTSTWRLPYRLADGSIDEKRLPKAIQAILSNYRGAQVTTIPEKDIPTVLRRLAEAAESLGRMPGQTPNAAPVYQLLADALNQLGGS